MPNVGASPHPDDNNKHFTWEAKWKQYAPEKALLVSGSFGGPFVIFTLTPLRNGLTLASQDRVSTMASLYRRCFIHGFRSGWVGGLWPSIPAIPQFCVLGPMYHIYASFLGQKAALVCTAVTETAITYGANTRNAEVAYNHYVPRTDRLTNLTPAYKPIGPGAFMHATRNALGMCGMRVFAAPLDEHMRKVIRNPQASRMLSDFVASCLSGAISMPFNQLYNFFVTSKEARAATRLQRVSLATTYLKGQYLTVAPDGSVRPSRIMLRDMGMRCLYAGTLFCIYATIERNLVENWSFLSERFSS
ncbi:hypothetical protein Pmar_PMAR019119 [Perkinsus marinus ATCC 50983]|uniref:Mitochondrial carrier protein n=1 Tax=Perkinsus marinus (strain ATCC 50983 / TXsc) TaxID=423536 RepID=C5KTX3_PERM5|nr:hypothetical protein Pmar_PMAR019119 [Perkinsus marinus ATCC 50983]EER12015.1 hypothetical protein Pmar_PMAR019119 [Perkinsus marinus ATCC 50983]|eukprot:XP_002780220.1 hypothetical protein Pmar_PMAR019119 [Perkinsus marinus ATCC 50983]